jgi:HEAT repeat protein
VRRNLWIRAVLLAAVGTAAAAAAAAAAATAPPPDARGADPALPAVPSTEGYRAALLAPATASSARDEAARRLAVGGTPGDVEALRFALSRGGLGAQAAAARAVAVTTDPDPSWVGPLAALLGPNRVVTDAAATALAGYAGTARADEAFEALRRFATNGAFPPLARAPAVRPLGAFANRQAAASLIDLLDDHSQTVQQAATNGLIDMTGEADRGNVPANWHAWWAAHRGDTDPAWTAYLLAARSREAGPARAHQKLLVEDARDLLESDYYSLPTGAKRDHLDAYLRAGAPEIREEGAKLALGELGNRQVLDGVLPRVRELIADEDPAVRLAAVAAVQGAVDQQAGPALVAQLGRERDAMIRIRLAAALEKLQDLDAAGPLTAMLDDRRPAVAAEAAKALRGIGAQLRQQRPLDAAVAATALRRALAARPAMVGPAADEFRAACVDALAVLDDPQQSFQTFRNLLNAVPPEPRDVRVAALNGFGTLADTRADVIVADSLKDDDPQVRYAAARALQTVGTEQEVDQLFSLLNGQQENDRDVREAAWQSLAHLLANGSVDLLQDAVKRFPDDPARQLVVRQDYGRALEAAGQADGVAANNQEVAETLLKLNRPDEAIAPLQAAVDYYQKKAPPGGGGDLENLVEQMLTAQLKAHRYAAATDFASREIRQYPSYQPTAGRAFRDAAEDLRSAGDAADLDTLVNAATAIQPPLESLFIDHLNEIREQLRASQPRP